MIISPDDQVSPSYDFVSHMAPSKLAKKTSFFTNSHILD